MPALRSLVSRYPSGDLASRVPGTTPRRFAETPYPCSTKHSARPSLASTPTLFRIQLEVDCSGIKCDQDHFHTVGLPDAAVRESRDRVRAALKNCSYDIPPPEITINLAPADIKKEGSGFDLPMALGFVGAYDGLTKKEIPDCLFVGHRSLDGGVRRVRGASPIAVEARGRKIAPPRRSRSEQRKKQRWSAVSMSIPSDRCLT